MIIHPILANSLQFAFEKATPEGKLTIIVLATVSLVSWTVIISKIRQLRLARVTNKKFMAAYETSRDPLEIEKTGKVFEGSPLYTLYAAATKELDFHFKNNPINFKGKKKVSPSAFDNVKVSLESAAMGEALQLEKGMIVLSTAVAGGPFIGLLGTVWGVMETFAGIAKANSASLTAMAPGVAGALIATVIGLLVAIPAMFAYNFMVTTIRAITQELDIFAAKLATQIEHTYVAENPFPANERATTYQERELVEA